MPLMLFLLIHTLLILGVGGRILLRDDLSPDARMAWLATIIVLPYLGCALYLLFGEVTIGRYVLRREQRAADFMAARLAGHPAAHEVLGDAADTARMIAPAWLPAFGYAASINGVHPVPGNHAELMANGAAARERMLADMDAARREINVLYYIWLDDETGTRTAHALMRAAQRGVTCRAMADGLGSRAFIHSPLWRQMREAGVQTAIALPFGNLLKVLLTSRIDLRNHRKITLIDGGITYVGSQNCADEAFRVKAKYAPWVDVMLRVRGRVVSQMQWLFASDWMQTTGQSFDPFQPLAAPVADGFPAVVTAMGPTERPLATPQLLSVLIAAARRELTISTPYFVPDATVLEALCAAAWRGVQVTLILPARNDSWVVGAASRSTYRRLLTAGVALHEFRGGLLHAKTLTVDGQVTLIGSTNLDLRSFDLNFENNLLLQDAATTADVRARQHHYINQSVPVTLDEVLHWPWYRRIWHNMMATVGPLL